ncbi:hypothetical protein GGR56DRAFT_613413 [Xylariaceae sp. FL0804]|nr:hypothetical protein GGR56DRAFT_613413 [Xylariaceae sp. FL0804]
MPGNPAEVRQNLPGARFSNNHNFGTDQVLGVKQEGYNNHQGSIHHWYGDRRLGFVVLGIVAIVVTALTFGLAFGLHDPGNTDQISSSPPSPTGVDTHTTAFSSPSAQPIATTSTPSATKAVAPSAIRETTPTQTTLLSSTTQYDGTSCTYGCDEAYLETGGCVWGCPGALCTNYNDCADPWPCITHVCCRTGCKSGWSCSGECAPGLVCVSATGDTAASTCQPTAGD